jgi:hypothetical protein
MEEIAVGSGADGLLAGHPLVRGWRVREFHP